MIPVLLHVATGEWCIVAVIIILNAAAQTSIIQIRNIAAMVMSFQRVTGLSRNAADLMDITPNLQSAAIIRFNQFQDIQSRAAVVLKLMTLSIIFAATVTCIISEIRRLRNVVDLYHMTIIIKIVVLVITAFNLDRSYG